MISAFLIGLFGSLHCVGMCSPLMLSFTPNRGRKAVTSFFLYHLGRLGVYALLGVLFGLISSSVGFFAMQRYFSLILGVVIIAVFAFPKVRNRFEGWYYHSRFYQIIKSSLTKQFGGRARWMFGGVLNGFLPCGLVYLAAAGAMVSHSILQGVQYMFLFGMGTIPLLALVKFGAGSYKGLFKKVNNLTTPIALIAGLMMVARGFMVAEPDINHLIQAQIMNVVSACGF